MHTVPVPKKSESKWCPVMTEWEQEYRKLRIDECLARSWKANVVLGACCMIMFTVARATGHLGNANQILVLSLTYMTTGMATRSRRVVALLHQLPSLLGFALLHGVPTLMTSVCCCALIPHEWMDGRRAILPHRLMTVEFALFLISSSSMAFISLDVLLLGTLPTCAIKWILMHWTAGIDRHAILMGIISAAVAALIFYGNEKQERDRCRSIFAAKEMVDAAETIMASARAAVEHIFDASCLCTKSGTVVASTPALEKLLQREASGSTGRADSLLVLVDDMMRLLSFLNGTSYHTERPTQLPVTLRLPNGPSLEASLYCVAVDETNTKFFVAFRVTGRPWSGHTIEDTRVLFGQSSETPGYDSDAIASSPEYQDWRQVELACSLKTYIAASFAVFLIGCTVMLEISKFPSAIDLLVAVSSGILLLESIHSRSCASRHVSAIASQKTADEYKPPLAEWRLQNRLIYVVTQVGLLWVTCSLITKASVALPSPELRHRSFLFSYLIFGSKLAPLVDLHIIVYTLCIVIQFGWYIKFHQLVDFTPLPNIVFGGVITTMGLVNFIHSEQLRRKTYAILQAEDAARESLMARRDAYSRLVSGLFDATCTCDMDGIVRTDTPHFREQFGTLIDRPLALIGADMHSRMGLADFVKLAKEKGSGKAMQKTLKLASRQTEDTVVHAQVLAVMHPAAAWQPGKMDGQGERVFIGVQQLECNSTKEASTPSHITEESLDKHSYFTCLSQSNTIHREECGFTQVSDSVSPWDSVSNCARRFAQTKENDATD